MKIMIINDNTDNNDTLDLLERCPPTQPYPALPPLSLVTRINLNHNRKYSKLFLDFQPYPALWFFKPYVIEL